MTCKVQVPCTRISSEMSKHFAKEKSFKIWNCLVYFMKVLRVFSKGWHISLISLSQFLRLTHIFMQPWALLFCNVSHFSTVTEVWEKKNVYLILPIEGKRHMNVRKCLFQTPHLFSGEVGKKYLEGKKVKFLVIKPRWEQS